MNRDRLNKFTLIQARIGTCMNMLLEAQEELAILFCECNNMTIEYKSTIMQQTYINMGIKIERLPT